MLRNRGRLSTCEVCGYAMVWSTKQQHWIHSINTKVECPSIRKRDNNA